MGGCHSVSGRPAEALEAYRKAQALLERLIEADPADLESRSSLAVVINNIGIEYAEAGRPDQALPLFQRYLAIHQELVQATPTHAGYRQMLAYAHGNVGEAQYRSGRFGEALRTNARRMPTGRWRHSGAPWPKAGTGWANCGLT
jgi:tetratricopeptide (TPR) repeat protein